MNTLRSSILFVLLALACNAVAGDDKTDQRPQKLVASIEGFLGASYRIELGEGDTVIYLSNPHTFTRSPGTTRSIIKIDHARWMAFRKALDEAKVWKWKKSYSNTRVMDGTVWELSVKYQDADIDTHGNNAYPDKQQFEIFRTAVVKLLGGKKFN